MAVYGDDNDNGYFADALPTIYAGDGDDTVGSGGGFLLAYGGNGADTLYQNGTGGLDAFGGYGNDYLIALYSTNTCFLYGEEGNDIVIGGTLSDYLEGGRGNDYLAGGAGNDRIYGGEDDDGIVTITAGAPRGSFSVSEKAGLYGEAGNDYIDGGAGDDDIYGGTDDDTLYGGDGSDLIRGEDGADYLDGGRGEDILSGGAGVDRMIGGDGSDFYVVDNAADVVIEAVGGGAADEVNTNISYSLDAHAEIESLYAYDYNLTDAIALTGNDFSQEIIGNAGKNTLFGLGGSDVLNGYLGADTMIGGAGDDTYYVDARSDQVVEAAGGGTDTVLSSVSYTLAASQQIEELRLLGSSALSLAGNALAQRVIGNDGANVLNGGWGNDVLAGGGGADTFAFNSAIGTGNVDRITDFAADDTIRLSDDIFKALAPGPLAASAFKNITTGTADASDRLLYKQSTGELFYDADGLGSGLKIKVAVFDNKAALTAADVLVV